VMQADDVRVLLVRQVLQHLPGTTRHTRHTCHVGHGDSSARASAAGRRERWHGAIEGRDVEVRRIVDQLKSGSGCASTLHEPNIYLLFVL